MKSEATLANGSRAQFQRQLNLAQDRDDDPGAVKFRKIADNVGRVVELA